MNTQNVAEDSSQLKVVVTRTVNAPVDLVYRAWTDPKLMAQWFSPADVVCKDVKADVKVGGTFRIHMDCSKGERIAIGKYKEVVPNKRLRFTWDWEHYNMPNSVITIDFEDLGKTTKVTLTHQGFPDAEDRDDHNKGWTSLMDNFTRLLDEKKIK